MKTKKQKGSILLEIVITMGIFVTIISVIVFLILDSENNAYKNTQHIKGLLYAQEGVEVVRSIRNKDFSLLENGVFGLNFNNGTWELFEGQETIDNFFTRIIEVVNITPGASVGTNTGGINGGNTTQNGTIKVCNIIIDAYKNQNTGSGYADSFQITLRKPSGQSWVVSFTVPILATEDILSDAPGLDAACVNNINLPYGQYSYDRAVVTNGGTNWQTITYNDQYTEAISTVNDFFSYGNNLDSNGLIDITSGRKDRALVVLNKLTQTATAQGEGRSMKKITSTVSWESSPGNQSSVQTTEFLTEWDRLDSDRLLVDTSGTRIASGTSNKGIRGVLLSNPTAKTIVLDKILLNWSKPSSNLSRITINGSVVFSGTATSGTTIDISNRTLSPGTFNVEINPFLWTQSMTGVSIDATFIMTDGSSATYAIPRL